MLNDLDELTIITRHPISSVEIRPGSKTALRDTPTTTGISAADLADRSTQHLSRLLKRASGNKQRTHLVRRSAGSWAFCTPLAVPYASHRGRLRTVIWPFPLAVTFSLPRKPRNKGHLPTISVHGSVPYEKEGGNALATGTRCQKLLT